jgi:hypothetical protein
MYMFYITWAGLAKSRISKTEGTCDSHEAIAYGADGRVPVIKIIARWGYQVSYYGRKSEWSDGKSISQPECVGLNRKASARPYVDVFC